MMNILIIDEGSPGHLSQSLGVVSVLEEEGVDCSVEIIRFRYRLKGVFRPLMRFVMNSLPARLYTRLLPMCGELDERAIARTPDVIISSGGKSIFASYVLKHRYQCKSIFVGIPDPYPDRWFDLIVSPVKKPFFVPYVVTGMIPNSMTPEVIKRDGAEYWRDRDLPKRTWALFIGGNSKSHHYTEEEWDALLIHMVTLSQRYGIKWLVTTSRRTPLSVEERLATMSRSDVIEELVLYNREPKKVLKPFLYAAERIFVTQDSLTMASEAYNSQKPVTLLTPMSLKIKKGSDFEKVIDTFSSLPGVDKVPMVKLDTYLPRHAQKSNCPEREWGRRLKEILLTSNAL